MKYLWYSMVVMVLALQYRLWVGEGSFSEVAALESKVQAQKAKNRMLVERNARLDAEVLDLKNGYAAIEERARHDLGMVGEHETFYIVVSGEHSNVRY